MRRAVVALSVATTAQVALAGGSRGGEALAPRNRHAEVGKQEYDPPVSEGSQSSDNKEILIMPTEDDYKDALATLEPDKEVLYAVSTGKEMHDTRAKGVLHSWCSPLASCIFYSDAVNPSREPITIPINVTGTTSTDPFRLAQLRYMRILRHATFLVNKNVNQLFSQNKWLIVTDDDTYVFHYNLHQYLMTLDSSSAIYTGHTLPPYVYPVNDDGHGNELGTSVRTHFVCGGGGSVFSHGALGKLAQALPSCIVDSSPGHFMSDWNSDWMIGECAHRAGVELLDQTPDKFGQFVFGEDKQQLQPTDPGRKMYCVEHFGRCKHPLTLHPVHEPTAMSTLWHTLSNSTQNPVDNVAIRLRDDGDVEVF